MHRCCTASHSPSLPRDPNLMETVEVYDGTSAFLKDLNLDKDELTKVRGVGGSGEKPAVGHRRNERAA